jgi:2-isopropylmalate synthase
MALKTRQDVFGLQTGIDATLIVPTSKLVSTITGYPVQPNKAVVGANAFAHSSGIHQDGFLKHAQNYEIMNPEDVGVPSSAILLTSRSGRAALRHRLNILGFDFEKPELDKIYTRFLLMADARKMIHDEDLKELVG